MFLTAKRLFGKSRLILFILGDLPVHVDRISMGLFFMGLYFKGSQDEIS